MAGACFALGQFRICILSLVLSFTSQVGWYQNTYQYQVHIAVSQYRHLCIEVFRVYHDSSVTAQSLVPAITATSLVPFTCYHDGAIIRLWNSNHIHLPLEPLLTLEQDLDWRLSRSCVIYTRSVR
ncbi:hypothetical protein O9929_26425 [Vibrio lentus]|nr:hypothetical protein [Vibrio lentus]